MSKGRVTIPTDDNFIKETIDIVEKWGADAIRDCDGFKLPREIKGLAEKIYSTYFVARGDNEWANANREELQQTYLMTKHHLATEDSLAIKIMDGYFEEQVQPDSYHDVKEFWEVIDRTTGDVVSLDKWEYNEKTQEVTIKNIKPWHEYTVSFLAYCIWDPTQMYNHITNNWGDKPHEMPFDARKPKTNQHIFEAMHKWLDEHPETDVVRFTTFFYHFTLVFNNLAKEKFVDWFGYSSSVSAEALREFEKVKGYKLRPEHIIDQGYYNSSFRVPTKEYLDYMDFQQQFVALNVKKLVDIAHEHGREAMMFLGDNWIGTEPYGKYFEEIGLDAVVGSVGSGATLRMISDIPGVKYTEGRFLPYFFPDTFYEGNDPTIEARENWLTARRALMRKPVDRIGYGGYLSLAYKFPNFVEYIGKVCDEFREIYDNIDGNKPYCGLTVAILNCWGKLRTWQTHMVAHALWYKQIYTYLGVIEALSGMSLDVKFISFDDIKNDGIPEGIDVIINAGDAGTAFSGGEKWNDCDIITNVRKWIFNGGGFVGIGEPSAVLSGGHYFQLSDALGVEKELGFSLSTDKYFKTQVDSHFITEDLTQDMDFGESQKNIYATNANTEIIKIENGDLLMSANKYGKGRAVYIAGLPYSEQNTRLLMRSCFYAANKESEMKKWYVDNIYCEVSAYLKSNKYAIVNNSNEKQITNLYDGLGNVTKIELEPAEIRWMDI
ncbi:1,3-beta-galactosyl-N-acetylhexosamine phosphorylase [Clostridium chauvoei]|uniref:1,3-beta-galactosyl-N-acetylhexosamine phosphorylase n=2 Tax=Clostridium chauvoei TaxID=46867 RepID=S6F389_9CLOT|nr:1,3-beta-galactosyl-N-acetylhexosamine phosphorylase [Clostridium chauvoei]ATD54005.1 1,3-beta-galactosyl-N-acetylhexosamine phosphorylase [Clostridium chauvoei]ATD58541.1 1,3-beta-galactosyl-N-acetylhexosamine phosphorylase [Clostridium chauvoei]MBX7281797.1 1,3-beta-galactosyl-N-acetylhexosamine phosphorylase [Clostridium chauvoei]MBX7284310.1 1,3-beta-galactosyl-N-acetylhexosamine phosphorylase [Clostridium chauvoei]MBX7286826.1 1,3-beta-galactosyl-N-acetylhexosamine phosphorylase [Clost